MKRIARELGVREDSVRRSLERAGIRLRDSTGRKQDATPDAPDHLEVLASTLPAIERLRRVAAAIRELATEYLFDHPYEPAAQEFMLAARRVKEAAADCLFNWRVCLRVWADQTGEVAASGGAEAAAIDDAARLVAARREAMNSP